MSILEPESQMTCFLTLLLGSVSGNPPDSFNINGNMDFSRPKRPNPSPTILSLADEVGIVLSCCYMLIIYGVVGSGFLVIMAYVVIRRRLWQRCACNDDNVENSL